MTPHFYIKVSGAGFSLPGDPVPLKPLMAHICLDATWSGESLENGDLAFGFVTEVSRFVQGGYAIRRKG
jgi:hypothetical protein